MSTISVFYTGLKAKLVKRGEGEFLLRPNESKYYTGCPKSPDAVLRGYISVTPETTEVA
jgi:hypothetical protein